MLGLGVKIPVSFFNCVEVFKFQILRLHGAGKVPQNSSGLKEFGLVRV